MQSDSTDVSEARAYARPGGRAYLEFKDEDGNVVATVQGDLEQLVVMLRGLTANLLYMPISYDW